MGVRDGERERERNSEYVMRCDIRKQNDFTLQQTTQRRNSIKNPFIFAVRISAGFYISHSLASKEIIESYSREREEKKEKRSMER